MGNIRLAASLYLECSITGWPASHHSQPPSAAVSPWAPIWRFSYPRTSAITLDHRRLRSVTHVSRTLTIPPRDPSPTIAGTRGQGTSLEILWAPLPVSFSLWEDCKSSRLLDPLWGRVEVGTQWGTFDFRDLWILWQLLPGTRSVSSSLVGYLTHIYQEVILYLAEVNLLGWWWLSNQLTRKGTARWPPSFLWNVHHNTNVLTTVSFLSCRW